MSHLFSAFCEDFYVNMRLGSQMTLPHTRETVLHFMERVQKQYPDMTRFKRTENDLNLEEERHDDGYRWLSIESKRLSAGFVNPATLEQALELHQFVLNLAPYDLGISPLEVDYLDLLFGFDLNCHGNHDQLVAETLLAGSPLASLAEEPGARPVDFQPSFTLSLSEDCRLQARLDVVTRTSSYQVRTGEYGDDMISIYLVLRRYWGDRPKMAYDQMIEQLADRAQSMTESLVIPRILRPISEAIGSRF